MTTLAARAEGEGVMTDEAARSRRMLKTGIAGTVIAAICCFTPLLAVLFGLVGLSAWLGYADYVVFPALAFFIALTAYALVRQRRLEQSKEEKQR